MTIFNSSFTFGFNHHVSPGLPGSAVFSFLSKVCGTADFLSTCHYIAHNLRQVGGTVLRECGLSTEPHTSNYLGKTPKLRRDCRRNVLEVCGRFLNLITQPCLAELRQELAIDL